MLFYENFINLAKGRKVTAKDSIEAPIRWRKSNLTDGKWSKSKNPEKSKQLLALQKEREIFLSSLQTDKERKELAGSADPNQRLVSTK